MPTPEAISRQYIEAQLAACSWVVQDRAAIILHARLGVVVRKYPLETGYADYLLWVDRKAGVIEAKAEGLTLNHVADQAGAYTIGLPTAILHVSCPSSTSRPLWRRSSATTAAQPPGRGAYSVSTALRTSAPTCRRCPCER